MISATTRVCASLGHWPATRRSTSPIMMNAAFDELGADYRWLLFQPDDVAAAMSAIRTLKFAGVAVTKPFKEQILRHLDRLDPVAARIGAVNLVRSDDGVLTGYNSDWIGAAGALREKAELAGKRGAVLGAGGAARAVVFGLIENHADVHVFSRSTASGQQLAADLGAVYGGQIPEVTSARPQILVNATSIGNDLQSDVPVPDAVFGTAATVMDIIVR